MNRIRLAFALILCSTALAQNEGQLQSEFRREREELAKNCSALKSMLGCLQVIATGKPLHLTGGGLAPQSGFGFGPAFAYEKNLESWRLSTNADGVAALNGSWRTGVYLKAVRTAAKQIDVVTDRSAATPDEFSPTPVPEFNFYVQGISLQKLHYYGEGQFTPRSSLAMFGMRQTIAGGNVIYPMLRSSGLSLFGELNGRWVALRGRNEENVPSIEQRFSEATAPGLATQPAYLQTGEGVKFNRSWDFLHLNYSAILRQFTAVSESRYSFQRLTLDFNHEIPLYRHMRRISPAEAVGPDESPASLESPRYTRNREGSITLRALLNTSYTSDGSVVPFYFQPTLGGSDINGDRMLPSYADYRFRAPNLMLFSATAEHSIWGPIGGIFRADTGRVAITRGDLGFEHLRHSFATGLTIRAGGLPQVMFLFAWGGGEGTHNIFYISPSLLGSGGRPSLY
jgi:hypothetical protein